MIWFINVLRRMFKRAGILSPAPTLASLDAYALWAKNYPPYVHNPLMQAEETTMLGLMPDLRDQVVLDLACGSGRFSRIADDLGARQVIAIDNSFAMLMTGRNTLIESAPEFTQATLSAIPLKSASVDVLLCGLAVGHIPTLAATMVEISRVLRRGGVALISDFHPYLFLSGKQRTFTAPDGKTFAVEHYVHLHSTLWSIVRDAGLVMDALEEPHLTVDGYDVPVVVVYRLTKPSVID